MAVLFKYIFMRFFNKFKKLKFIPIVLLFIFIVLVGALLLRILIIKEDKKAIISNEESLVLAEASRQINNDEGFKKARLIDGVFMPEDSKEFYPKAVTIENNVDARPQSGLSKANLVIEAPVEGGITRFLAVFADNETVSEIGPVRSARPYFLDWARELNAVYAHVGGSPEAINIIKSDKGLIDLDQYFLSQYYWRSSKRPRPHNVYTSTELLNEAVDYFLLKESDFEVWNYKDDLSLTERPEQTDNILIDFSTYANRVEWKYIRESNDYLRYAAGEKHLEKDGGEIRAKNIIIQKTSVVSLDIEDRKKIKTIGDGEAIIFLDGRIIEGVWKKEAVEKRTRFYDKEDNEVEFNRGTTWIEVVGKSVILEY